MFLALIEPGEGTEDTRRRATLAELTPAGRRAPASADVLDAVAERPARHRGRRDGVEVAHEALHPRVAAPAQRGSTRTATGAAAPAAPHAAAAEWDALGA